MNSKQTAALWASAAALLVTLGVAGRLLPHAPNFTPAASVALFAGFLFPTRTTAAAVALALMLVSDCVVGFYEPTIMAAVYGGILVPLAFRGSLRRGLGAGRVLVAAASSSVAFFLLTNLAVWWAWGEHNAAGMLACYVEALPFFKYTLAGDLLWSSTLFGAYALIAGWMPARELAPIRVESGLRRRAPRP